MISRIASRILSIGVGIICGFLLVYLIYAIARQKSVPAIIPDLVPRATFFSFSKPVIHQRNDFYSSWKRCITGKFDILRGNHSKFWEESPYRLQECDQPFVEILKIKNYTNMDEQKYHIHPVMNTSERTRLVTLGIGHDTKAEEALLKELGKDNVLLFGADPMIEINKDLYSKIGKFYPFAVSGKAGYSTASALDGDKYTAKSVVYVDAVYFLTQVIGLKFFDAIWMDAESGEYEMFPLLLKGGGFDKAGVTICQLNMEIHMPNDEQKKLVYDFMFNALDDQRYAFFYAAPVGHLRVYMVNFDSKECLDKYIPKEFSAYKLP